MNPRLVNASFLRHIYPGATWRIPTQEKEVFLTFDDGPHPEITSWVLSKLDEFNAKATFFCIGDNVRKHPETYQKIIDKGHTVGNHTYMHSNGFRQSTKAYMKDVERCTEFVTSNLFRPPYGRMRRSQFRRLKSQYQVVMWSMLSQDYLPSMNPQRMLKYMCDHTKSGDVVIFHDSEKAEKSMKTILPEYLSHLSKQGFKMSSIVDK